MSNSPVNSFSVFNQQSISDKRGTTPPRAEPKIAPGKDFSRVIRGVSSSARGRDIAAWGGKKLPSPTLHSYTLGSRVKIITAATHSAGEAGLLEFARAQGIDEDMLKLIMANKSDAQAAALEATGAATLTLSQPDNSNPVPPGASSITPIPSALIPADPLDTSASNPANGSGQAAAALNKATLDTATSDTATAEKTASSLANKGAGQASPPFPSTSGAESTKLSVNNQSLATSPQTDPAVGTSPGATALLVADKAPGASLGRPPAIQTAADTGVTSPPPLRQEPTGQAQAVPLAASGTTGLPIDLSKQHQTIPPEAGATAEEQQHSRQQATEEQAQEPMTQAAQAEQDESSLSAKNIQFHQSEKTNPGKPGLNEQEFTARIGAIAEATSPPTGALPGVLSGESAATTTAPVAHGAPPARQLLDVSNPLPIREETMQEAYFRRSEQNQIAADKLAEAIGQRLSAQIEKGIWQVNLQLRPAHLGKIDIRLSMQGKGNISAEFSASEVQTKDLLNSGLPRLREIFAQSGIDLATMQAKHDAATGHSDNPAPRQPATPASQGQPSRETIGETVARPQAQPKLGYVGRDGLDITV